MEVVSAGSRRASCGLFVVEQSMNVGDKLQSVAQTDSMFRRVGANWVGKCLICNGPLAFDARTGEGATLEHIRARGRGGTGQLQNLAIVHGRCNWEKGRRWDPKKRCSQDDYESFIARLLERRLARWPPAQSAPE
jgi:5-methylcytosine-specific restriction endonuclease McrA